MKMHPLQIIGIVLVLVGTAFIYIGQNSSAEKRNQELIKKSDKIEELSEKNIILNQEITNLNKQVTGYLTGDSFCVVSFERFKEKSDIVLITVSNEGDNPLYELTATIVDIEERLKEGGKGSTYFGDVYEEMKKDQTIGFPIIPPGQGKMVTLEFPFFERNNRVFNINFSSRSGNFTQFYREININGHWRKAVKVFKQDLDKPLYEKIDPEFPREKNGEVKWQ
jgi:hypothetical protein